MIVDVESMRVLQQEDRVMVTLLKPDGQGVALSADVATGRVIAINRCELRTSGAGIGPTQEA